jgi:ABC-type antimicrobial peptide transport system permease subunit
MSSGAGFPVNDLMRRKLQTGLTLTTLTLCVASTLFLLLFSSRLGVGIASATNTLTLGLSNIFSQFILFIGVLVFVVGAVLVSFIVFLMMAQRTRDFGLIKAAGCPNSLVAGYFLTELFTVTAVGCVFGVVIGFLADFVAATVVFSGYSLPDWWFGPIVFGVFFVLSVVFGLQPLLKAAKMSAVEALSPINYFGTALEGKQKALSHTALSWRLATRSLWRRLSPTFRIVFLLSIVYVLLTVSVAGGIIAKDTTTNWIENTTSTGTIAIAYSSMGEQYEEMLSKFTGEQKTGDVNYSDPKLAVPNEVNERLEGLSFVTSVDPRLVLYERVQEISNHTALNGAEVIIGGEREGTSLVIGLDPQRMAADFSSKGTNLDKNASLEAIIGDSISLTMYYRDKSKYITLSDPLMESIQVGTSVFRIVGVCIDAINNGYVTYVPLDGLMNATGVGSPNLVLITLNGSVDRSTALPQIENVVESVDPALKVFDLSPIINANRAFLGSTWQTIMFIPLVTLASAAFCLVGYVMLTLAEQRQEFAMLRAVGAKPNIIVRVSAIESLIVLLSSLSVGLTFGVIITLLILMANPLITLTTILAIGLWLASALAAMFLLSLYPAVKLSKTPILNIAS